MSLRQSIERLPPYPSLLLLALPTATVEPLKMAALAVAGKGHWITGTAMFVVCYGFSLLVVERLFLIVKPKLLRIAWFAKIWSVFVSIRARVLRSFASLIRSSSAGTGRAVQTDEAVIDPRSAK